MPPTLIFTATCLLSSLSNPLVYTSNLSTVVLTTPSRSLLDDPFVPCLMPRQRVTSTSTSISASISNANPAPTSSPSVVPASCQRAMWSSFRGLSGAVGLGDKDEWTGAISARIDP
ncbi:hypothetical protein CVT26_011519 [Gymnopilus dilepis]|uniref:Secreted protein n=1 Tax=Gymnopilus dilepis TaxID=231916 RepID=A0A409W5J6_9AGAR|nr:hypothetical protein CVT26_011519 [Gymnopilus dilepis]